MAAIAEGVAALNSLRSLYEIAKSARNSNDPEKIRADAAQMFDLAFAAREQTAALQEERNAAMLELAALKAEVEKAKRFDEQRENYAREITHTGTTVYREKNSAGAQGQSPYYCPHCFGNKQLSILNPFSPSIQREMVHTCPICGMKTLLPKLGATVVTPRATSAEGTHYDPFSR